MKALVVAPQPFFTPRGTPYSVYYRTLVMAQQGVEIDFLTYGQGEEVDIPGVRIIRTPSCSWLGQVRVGPSALKVLLDFFIFWQMLWLLCTRRYDFVHAHEEAVFIALLLKPIFRYKLLYDMHSSLAQQLSNFNFTRSPLLIGLFRRMEEASLRNAEAVITICPDLRDYVNTIIDEPKKHFLIENSLFMPVRLQRQPTAATTREGVEANAGQLAVRLKSSGRKLIVYAGTLEHYQGIDLLVEALVLVAPELPKVCCLVLGGTPAQAARYRTLATERGLNDQQMLFTGQVPQQQAKEALAQASLLVSPRIEGTNTPLKLYEQLASGIPLVATAIYSHTQVLRDEVAFLAEPLPEALAKAIQTALNRPDLARAKAAAARHLYEIHYAEDAYRDKMHQLLAWIA